MARKKRDPYSKETIREKRSFPVGGAIGIGVIVVVQIVLIVFAVLYTPKPQDVIREYEIVVTPQENGALVLDYRIVWTPLDENEPLTWVEIGMPNHHFTIDRNSLSETIRRASEHSDGDYVSAQLDLDRAYYAGETLELSFRIYQERMLCEDEYGYFYRLIPGWFNSTPVEYYSFRWAESDQITDTNAVAHRYSEYVWEGKMDCGEYVSMYVAYEPDAFGNARTEEYVPFDSSGVYDELYETKLSIMIVAIGAAVLLLIAEVYIIDSFVSYHRGRGFLMGYGYHVHTYGRVNPRYRTENAKRSASAGRGGYSGGGCACACACACAGGGRAGCSQKDTYAPRKRFRSDTAPRETL